jgi:mRNA-degrading endonuclease RelE of RelBE toxin-antitoxin system
MAKLMVHRQILKDYHTLPSKVQKRVAELIEEFQKDPHSDAIGMHPLKGTTLDPKVRGVTKLPDGYRAIVIAPEKGDTYLLVHIGSHDNAYEWARNKRFEVHEMTGVFQVFDAEEVRAVADEVPQTPKATAPNYALSRLTDDELFAAGVPRPLIPSVRSINSDEGLEALSDYLPPDCRDVLYGLASGLKLDDALEAMLGTTPEETKRALPDNPGDFTKIQEAANFDLVLIEGEDELKKILQGDLEEWRVFLHPYQKKLVTWKTRGPMNINGAAGTGKTVALMHRAVHLARGLEAGGRVLVTTFTTNLSVTIKHQLERLAPDVADKIEVTNLHALARTICGRSGWKGRIAEDDELRQIWKEVWLAQSLTELPLGQEQMEQEYDQVIDANGIDEEETYLTTVRTGRPRITREDRRAAWPIFRAFQRGLKKRNLLTFEGAIHQARLAVEQGKFTRYNHVLVDEVQDFSLEALRLARAISPSGEESPDPLCTVGDGHQRIYRSKIPLSRAGIDIRGRSRRLKINYRTSEQIRKYAQAILRGVEIDDLDGGIAEIVGDHSVFKGPEPMIEKCKNEKSEAEVIVAWVQMLREGRGLGTHEICVTPYKPVIRTALAAANIPTYELKPREEDPGASEAGVRLGTMKRIKGLEFRAVALACSAPADPLNHIGEASLEDRCQRYVAATRAREYLLVTVAQ